MENTNREHRRVRTAVGTTSRTKQSMAAECDMNAIMRRHLAGGGIQHINTREGFYGDFTSIGDYQGAMQRIRAADERFARLPAHVRDHCGNDPAELVRMALDPERRDEMVELGLLQEVETEVKTPPSQAAPVGAPEPRPSGESPVQGGD